MSLVTEPDRALICTEVKLETEALVETVKLLVLFPAAMNTLGGTCAVDGSLLVNDTVVPPVGAGVASPTVPRSEPPPVVDTPSSPMA